MFLIGGILKCFWITLLISKVTLSILSVLGGSVKFVVDENVVVIDGNSGEISSDDTEATCTISTDADTMQSIMDGSSSPQAAFMTGKLKVAGDMSIALKVQSVIS